MTVTIEPRRQILEIWRSVAHYTRRDKGWSWGGRDGSNSISDAEHLLCLMYPATELGDFRLDDPDGASEDVLDALESFGDSRQIPRLLVDALADYMSRYTDPDGSPTFAAGSYFRAAGESAEPFTEEQLALDMVDSLSMSITLCLSTLDFVNEFRRAVSNEDLRKKLAELETATSLRLTSAIVGLLRSFTISAFSPDSAQGRNLMRQLDQGAQNTRSVTEEFHRRLGPVRASLRDARLGLSKDEALDNPNLLFEIGWSWGIVEGSPQVSTEDPVGDQPEGFAKSDPNLYFTVVALDGIADLFSERTRVRGLLNVEQQRLKDALQLRHDLTLGYWGALASMGERRSALQDIPWQTTDGASSDYFSLLVATIYILDLARTNADEDALDRAVLVLEELAVRGRISRRAVEDDAAVAMHTPGVRFPLAGAERIGPAVDWRVSDYSSLLFKRSSQAAGLARTTAVRNRLSDVSREALEHLWARRIRRGDASGLWDDPSQMFGVMPVAEELDPSWYLTERVVECLVTAAATIRRGPVRSGAVVTMATELVAEAEHVFSQEKFQASASGGRVLRETLDDIEGRITRSRELLLTRPGTALSIAQYVLRDLDRLDVARRDARRSM